MPTTVEPTSGTTAPAITDPKAWADAFLAAIGAPITPVSETLIMAWQQTEGQWSASGQFNAINQHNPLNIESTPQGYSGPAGTVITDSQGNSTLSFPTMQDGLNATVVFAQTNDPNLVAALQANSPGGFINSVGHWNPGSPGYPQQVLQNFVNLQSGANDWLSQIGRDVGNAITFGAIPGVVANGLNLLTWADALGHLLSDLISGQWWKRVGIGALGVALVVGGLVLFVSTTGTGKKIESDAAAAAVVA